MKFDNKTISILKNFSSINKSILFREGNTITTIADGKTLWARATVDPSFPSEFAIGDLSNFLSALSLFNDPELKLGREKLTMVAGSKKLDYAYADAQFMNVPPKGRPKLQGKVGTLKIPAQALSEVMKAASVLGFENISAIADEGKVSLKVGETDNSTSNSYEVELEAEVDTNFNAIFKVETLRLMPGDYDLEITPTAANFKGNNIEYIVTYQDGSVIGEEVIEAEVAEAA